VYIVAHISMLISRTVIPARPTPNNASWTISLPVNCSSRSFWKLQGR